MLRTVTVLLFVFVVISFSLADTSPAFEKITRSPDGMLIAGPVGPAHASDTLAFEPTTKDELLLFWDEKDLYVSTATRNSKPISQTAENMTVVTAKDIEDMNAHTVAEVLNRVSGISVDFSSGMDFGGNSFFHIQGSEPRHVLVLIDGVVVNSLSEEAAETSSIPVRIIERIEIIKGPASSSWGSALGGVINIITKNVGDTMAPRGALNASYGERGTTDDSAEVLGKVKNIGYYLFAGRRESDGLRNSRDFRDDSFYSKVDVRLAKGVDLGFTAGYSEPHVGYGVLHAGPPAIPFPADDTSNSLRRDFFGTAHLDATLTSELSLKTSFYFLNHKDGRVDRLFLPTMNILKTKDFDWDEKTTGGSARLVWTHGVQTAVLGTDISHGSLDETQLILQTGKAPMPQATSPELDKWAVYLNDTINVDKFSITPGLRYDHNNISGDFTSPSLGATYKFGERTIARASVARGFTLPPLGWSSGSGLFQNPNPSLEMEKVWSYQAGLETGLTDYLWLRLTVFEHDMKDEITQETNAATGYSKMVNKGKVKRTGYEAEAETAPFYSFSLKTGFAYARIAPDEQGGASPRDTYSYNAGLKYDDKKSFMAQLFGNYVWWNRPISDGARYNSFVFDLNISKKIFSTDRTTTELYSAVHNLFDASYTTSDIYPNPRRWAEAGIRFKF